MNNKPNEQLDELLASATEALRGGLPSDGPPQELVASTLDRMRLLDLQPTTPTLEPDMVRLAERRQLMFRIARYSSAVAAAILVAVFGWLFFTDHGRPAFARVIESVKKATSVTFTSKQVFDKQSVEDEGTIEMKKWYIQDQKIRMEVPGMSAWIADPDDPTYIEIDMVNKTAKARPAEHLFGDRKDSTDPVTQIANVKPEEAKLIGEEQLNGRTTRLFEFDKQYFLGARQKGRTKIWVDPKTQLPVKIRLEPAGKDRRPSNLGGAAYVEMTDFEWNKKLDEKLFQVPEDYTIKEEAQEATK